MPRLPGRGLMDAISLSPPRRLTVPIENRWGAGEMAVMDFGDAARPVDLIFVHANGFNAATYRSLLQPLSGSLRIWVPDLRGHGRTRLPTRLEGRRGWRDHRDDLIALLAALDGPPVVLAGHSMGGTSSLLAAAERPGQVSKLVLVEPVIWTRAAVLGFNLPFAGLLSGRIPIVQGALRRRNRFDDRQQALNAYRGRGAFKGWPDMMLADYLSDGLIEDSGGDGFVLTCTPGWEASNYAAQAHDPWRAMARLDRPIHILKGETGSTCAVPMSPRGLAHVTVDPIAEGTHFLPMLRPDLVRDALLDAAV